MIETDRNWVDAKLLDIPESQRERVIKEYRHIYQTSKIEQRKKANQYLSAVATEYRQTKRVGK